MPTPSEIQALAAKKAKHILTKDIVELGLFPNIKHKSIEDIESTNRLSKVMKSIHPAFSAGDREVTFYWKEDPVLQGFSQVSRSVVHVQTPGVYINFKKVLRRAISSGSNAWISSWRAVA